MQFSLPLTILYLPSGIILVLDFIFIPVKFVTIDPEDTLNNSGKPSLRREMNLFDTTLLLIGSVIGTAIFLVTGDIAAYIPSPGWILLGFTAAGLIALAGGLTMGELGAALPEAGGQYVYLREAFGRPAGFLFGWAFFFVIWNGGNAAVAVAFAEFLSFFFPVLSPDIRILEFSLTGLNFSTSWGQLTGVATVMSLTMLHYCGLRLGVTFQNIVTGLKVVALAGLVLLGFVYGNGGNLQWDGFFLTSGFEMHWISAFAVALIACTWTYDGWYALSCMGGEIHNPRKNIPLGNLLGVLVIILVYVAVNLVYFHALPIERIVGVTGIGEAAALALFGPVGASIISGLMVFSAFGVLNAGIISGPRVTYAMAADGLFFKKLAEITPKYSTPGPAIIMQGVVISVLCMSGTYRNLYSYVAFSLFIFYFFTGLSLFVLRFKRPNLERPYRAWGYPFTPLLFVLVNGALFVNTLIAEPVTSGIALAIILAGLPAYWYWRRSG